MKIYNMIVIKSALKTRMLKNSIVSLGFLYSLPILASSMQDIGQNVQSSQGLTLADQQVNIASPVQNSISLEDKLKKLEEKRLSLVDEVKNIKKWKKKEQYEKEEEYKTKSEKITKNDEKIEAIKKKLGIREETVARCGGGPNYSRDNFDRGEMRSDLRSNRNYRPK
jgi:hypothetical protein